MTAEMTVTYPAASTVVEDAARFAADRPVFFDGFATEPVPAARAMACVAQIAMSRFYMPAAMLAAQMDPVVTAEPDCHRRRAAGSRDLQYQPAASESLFPRRQRHIASLLLAKSHDTRVSHDHPDGGARTLQITVGHHLAIAYFDADGAPVPTADLDGLLLAQADQLAGVDGVARGAAGHIPVGHALVRVPGE